MENAVQELFRICFRGAFVEVLEQNKRFVLARQLLWSGTSVGANVQEAQHAESRADFVHKCKIAAKEAEGTRYWLQLCSGAPNYPDPPGKLLEQLASVRRLLAKIIVTAKTNAA
jgi:four helix bundle protein